MLRGRIHVLSAAAAAAADRYRTIKRQHVFSPSRCDVLLAESDRRQASERLTGDV